MRGSFIVFEGLDRSGKSSQASILCESLKSRGRKVLLWKYPARETFLGQTIDGYLKNSVSLPDRSIHLLFSANRWETVERLLSELNSGTDIVCDRYAYSGIAYSAAKGLDFEWCKNPDVGLPQPDIVLYMQVSAEVARLRGGYGEERYEKEEFQRKVGECFLRFSETEGSRWRVIDANRPIEAISSEVLGHVSSIPKEELQCCPSKLWTSTSQEERLISEAQGSEEPRIGEAFLSVESVESHAFGFLSIQSEGKSDRDFVKIRDLKPGDVGWIRARAQTIRRHGAKLAFVILREDCETIQAVVSVSAEMVRFASSLTKESVVDVFGRVRSPPETLRGCSRSEVELEIEKLFCVSKAESIPLQLEDLNRSEEENDAIRVHIDTRLNNRVMDLRTLANQSIFRIQSGVCQLFREFLVQKGFIEIHSPKLVASASEGGSSVFKLNYFNRFAYLAQSPQLYKQMALMGDFPGVFEIGPVFRAEKSLTHRHMTEFVGLDLEMPVKEHFCEIIDLMDSLFNFIFSNLVEKFKNELNAVRDQFPFNDIKWTYPCLKLEYKDAIDLLVRHGPEILQADIHHIEEKLVSSSSQQDDEAKSRLQKRKDELLAHLDSVILHKHTQDMGTSDEKLLGRIVDKIHDTNFYFVTKFPADLRPFYTMPCPKDPTLTNSYDIYLRGEEIVSGAQRIHDPQMLLKVAESKGVDLTPVQTYVDSFKYGAFPHGGGGAGLERIVMLFLGLSNIRLTSMFPRDPNRLTP